MSMLGFPLLLIPFAIYNIIAFLMPGVSWSGVIFTVHMMSGADWTMAAGDLLEPGAVEDDRLGDHRRLHDGHARSTHRS